MCHPADESKHTGALYLKVQKKRSPCSTMTSMSSVAVRFPSESTTEYWGGAYLFIVEERGLKEGVHKFVEVLLILWNIVGRGHNLAGY